MNVRHLTPVLFAAVLLGLTADLDAQDRFRRRGPRPAPQPQQQPEPEPEPTDKKVEKWTAIVGGDVHVGNGTILRRAKVLIGDDEIHGVGYDDVEIPDDAEIIDAAGKVVAPGFCIVKASGFGTPRSGSSAKDDLNPFDPQIKLGLAAGITSFLWQSGTGNDAPGGNSALVKLAWGDLEGMVAAEDPVLTMRVPLNPQQIRTFRQQVGEAVEYRKKLEAANDEEKKKLKAPRGADAILALMKGEKRLWIGISGGGFRFRRAGGDSSTSGDAEAIRQAMEIAELLGRGVVLDDPVTAWVIPDEIAATGSMAIVAPRNRVAPDESYPDTTGSNIAQAAILAAAGVPVAVTGAGGRFGGGPSIGTGGILGQDLNTPHVEAAFAVRGGLPNRDAIRTLTLDAARIMNVADHVGSIEKGKDADVLILDGDPLHYRTFVEQAFVNGKLVYVKDEEPFYRHIRR